MGYNLKSPVFIEFFGLPGCGKTTVSHELANQLRNDGYLVSEPNYDIVHNSVDIGRKLKKICQLFLYFLRYPNQLKICSRIVKNNGYRGKGLLRQLVNIVQKLRIYNTSKNQIYIWDQGYIQAAMSLSVNQSSNISGWENCKQIHNLFFCDPQIISVFLVTDKESALDRIEERKDGKGRIDSIKDKSQKEEILTKWEAECLEIANKVKCYAIPNDLPPERVAGIIKETIGNLSNISF